jgi:hypothetical protein
MKKFTQLILLILIILTNFSCDVSVNGESVYEFPENDKYTEMCGQIMVFYQERNTKIAEYYWGSVEITNTLDETVHLRLSKKNNMTLLDIYIWPLGEATYNIYISEGTDVVFEGWHGQYSCPENSSILEL